MCCVGNSMTHLFICSGIEVVITDMTRNHDAPLRGRGFESHPLRQTKTLSSLLELSVFCC